MSGTITKGATVLNCSLIKGQFAPTAIQVRLWRVAGHDGKSAQQIGKDSQAVKVMVYLFDSKSNYEAWRDTLFTLAGEVVTIVNSDGLNSGSVLVTDISPPTIQSGLPKTEVKAMATLTVETC